MTTQHSAVPAVFQDQDITIHEVKGEFVMTAIDIGAQLGYPDPGKAMNKLYRRHKDELEEFKGTVTLGGGASTGLQHTTVFTEEGIYLICMFARTEKAKIFRRRVAALLKDLRQRKMATIRKETALALIDLQHFLGKRGMDFVERLVKYRKKDLYQWEVGRLLDVSKDTVRRVEKAIKQAGLWEVL